MQTENPHLVADLRPLGLGEIIDRGVHFWRAHLGPLFALYFGIELVSYALQKCMTLFFAPTLAMLRDSEEMKKAMTENAGGFFGMMALYFVALVAFVIIASALSWLGMAIATLFCFDRMIGRPRTMSESFEVARQQFGRLLGVGLLMLIMATVLLFVSVLPGVMIMMASALLRLAGSRFHLTELGLVVMVVGMVVAMLWLFVKFMLAVPVTLLEKHTVWGSIKRSSALVSGRVGPGFANRAMVRATLVLTAVGLILVIASVMAAAPQWILGYVYKVPFGTDLNTVPAVPQAVIVPTELVRVLLTSVIAPLSAVVTTHFYLDLRIRKEAFDIELQAAARAP